MTIKLSSRLAQLSLLLASVLSNCQANLQSTPTLSPLLGKQVSLLVNFDAPTFIKRDGWKDYQPIGFAAIVYPVDLLRTDGAVLLLCADLKTSMTFTGVGVNPCPQDTTRNLLSYDGMLFDTSTRGAAPDSIPYILQPRGTAILNSRPALRWNDTGASSYTVVILQDGNIVWQGTEVTTDSIEYPPDAPELQPGDDYLLVVTDNDTGKSSNSDPNKGLGFEVITREQRAEVESQQDAISNLTELNTAAQKTVLAMYLDQFEINGRGIWAEAAALFEEALADRTDAPAVYLRWAATLTKMKLWSEARSVYELALQQAQSLNDRESQADAFAALWQISGDEAKYDRAISLYEEIGAQDKIDTLKIGDDP